MGFVSSIRSLLFALVLLAISAVSFAQIGIAVSIRIAPPELPIYEQPICAEEGAIWTPGYWAYGDEYYFWVPGTWVMAPEVGYLWNPAYWGFENDSYLLHDGYWGTQVGFYGGISYGYGYFGNGYEGGGPRLRIGAASGGQIPGKPIYWEFAPPNFRYTFRLSGSRVDWD